MNRIFHILLDKISMPQKVIVETTTKMPELKTQKQSEKLPDVPSAAHVWPRDTRIGSSHSFMRQTVCWSLFWRLRQDDNKSTRRQFAIFNEEKNGEIKLRKRFKKSNNWCSSIKHHKPNMKISVVMVLKDNEWLNLWRNIYSIIDYDEAKERLQKFGGLWVPIYRQNNLYSL